MFSCEHGIKYVVTGKDGSLEWKSHAGFIYADVCLMASSEEDMHVIMEKVNTYVIEYGLKVKVQGSKQHSLQAVELSQRIQTTVDIVSNPPAPSNRGTIYHFCASRTCVPTGWLALLLIKTGDIETHPGPTISHHRV